MTACGGASRPSPASDAQVAWHSLMDVVALRYVFGRNRLQLQSLTPPPRTTTMTTPPMTSWPPLLPLKHPFLWPYYSQSPGGGDGYVRQRAARRCAPAGDAVGIPCVSLCGSPISSADCRMDLDVYTRSRGCSEFLRPALAIPAMMASGPSPSGSVAGLKSQIWPRSF